MMILDTPPNLILPDHYQHSKPAIIRPGVDLASYFPVEINRATRRAIVNELTKRGFLDDKAKVRWFLDKANDAIRASIPFGMFAPNAGASSISFIASATADAGTIACPTVTTGDFLLYVEFPAQGDSGSTQMTPVTPTGLTFTTILHFPINGDAGGATRNDIAIWTYGRIVSNGAGESGTTITGYNADTGAGRRRKTILVFRGNIPFTAFGSAESASKVWATGDPGATSSPLSVGSAPFLALGFYRGTAAISSLSFTPTATGTVDNGTTTRVGYGIYNSADSNTLAIDEADSGSANLLVSYVLELS